MASITGERGSSRSRFPGWDAVHIRQRASTRNFLRWSLGSGIAFGSIQRVDIDARREDVGEQVPGGALLLEPRDRLGEVSGRDRRLVPVGGRERVREHDLGISFIGMANGPEAPGQ